MAKITINNSTFEYIEKGSGTPVIFVHGSINDYRIWKDQMEPFAKQFRAIAYNRRYHYPNKWDGDGSDYNIDLHVADLASLIKTLKAGRVHLVGSSYGAYISLITAIKYPGLVKSLVLGEPPILPLLVSNPENPLNILSLFIRDFPTAKSFMKFALNHMKPAMKALKNNQLEEGIRLFASGVMGDSNFGKLTDEKLASLMDNAQELKVELLGAGFPPFPKAEAKKINVPSLLVYGENSPKFFHSISDLLMKILPNCNKVIVPGVSHLIHRENPDYYNKKVLEFLTSHY